MFGCVRIAGFKGEDSGSRHCLTLHYDDDVSLDQLKVHLLSLPRACLECFANTLD